MQGVELKPFVEPAQKFSISWQSVLREVGTWRDSLEAKDRAKLLSEFCLKKLPKDSEHLGLSGALTRYNFEWFNYRDLSDVTFISELGKGTFGHVYKVLCGERTFALKLFDIGIVEKGKMSAKEVEGLLDFHYGRYEARCMLDLTLRKKEDFPFTKFYDYGITDVGGRVRTYILMEYLEGKDLWSLMGDEKSTVDVEKLTKGLFYAVHSLHSRGYAHADISPANIFICSSGEVKLIDLGSVCDVHVIVSQFLGTINPPENFVDPPETIEMVDQFRNDVWCTAYCVLYSFNKRERQRVFPRPNRESLSGFLDDLSLSINEIGERISELHPVVHWALSLNPEERPLFALLLI
nr:serine/threonine protein kinase [Marseillevirus futianmevirus]